MDHPRLLRTDASLGSRSFNAKIRTVLGKPEWLLILRAITNMKRHAGKGV